VTCVVTRRFSVHGKGFHRFPLCFHPNLTVTLRHPSADVSGDSHDY
jgi:hypothetical protein